MRRMFMAFATILLLIGCNSEPPSVSSKRDVARLPPETKSLWARDLSDDDIPSLARLANLNFIDFSAGWATGPAKVSDRGLAELAKLNLPNLDFANLGFCENITDAGLEHLASLKQLKRLSLPRGYCALCGFI
jgi:hypothetical protein